MKYKAIIKEFYNNNNTIIPYFTLNANIERINISYDRKTKLHYIDIEFSENVIYDVDTDGFLDDKIIVKSNPLIVD